MGELSQRVVVVVMMEEEEEQERRAKKEKSEKEKGALELREKPGEEQEVEHVDIEGSWIKRRWLV